MLVPLVLFAAAIAVAKKGSCHVQERDPCEHSHDVGRDGNREPDSSGSGYHRTERLNDALPSVTTAGADSVAPTEPLPAVSLPVPEAAPIPAPETPSETTPAKA